MIQAGLTRRGKDGKGIPIKAIGVWDTVGSLGVPEITVFGFIKMFKQERHEYSFVNTEVPDNVEYAYQALALDERRKPFDCTLWESPKPGTKTKLKELKQTWFPGVHSSVGGGYEDTSISDITLAWMMTQLSEHLTFDKTYIPRQQEQCVEFYKSKKLPIPSWACGQIVRSDTGMLNTMTGRITRTPGEYYVIDPKTGKATKTRLTNTCEFIHPSIRYRIQSKGPGVCESRTSKPNYSYDPFALRGWTYVRPNQPWRDDKALGIGDEAARWDGYGKWIIKRKNVSATYVVEEKIDEGSEEMTLVNAFVGVEEALD